MTKDDLDEMKGRFDGLTQALTAVIQCLPADHALRAAALLTAEMEASQKDDDHQNTPGAESAGREDMAGMYLGLLQSVASHGK